MQETKLRMLVPERRLVILMITFALLVVGGGISAYLLFFTDVLDNWSLLRAE